MKKSNENGNNSSPSPDDDVYLPDDQNKRQERENRISSRNCKISPQGKESRQGGKREGHSLQVAHLLQVY